jgi:hypothetical protein
MACGLGIDASVPDRPRQQLAIKSAELAGNL